MVENLGYNGSNEFAIVELYGLVERQENQVIKSVVQDLEKHFGQRPPRETPGVG